MVNIETRLIIFFAAKDGEALYSQQKQDQKSRRRNSTTTFQWDGWMASLTRWTWVWVNSGSWWWTGGPGMLQFMGSQRVGHDWATELNWSKVFTESMDMNLSKLQETVKDKGAWHSTVPGVAKSRTQFRRWATTKYLPVDCGFDLLLGKWAFL